MFASGRGRDPLFGRGTELQALDDLLDHVRAGARAAVALVGEPGIGKTRVLGELTDRASALGFDVLAGRAFELERDIPFGLVVETLDGPLSQLDPRVLNRLGDERVAELAALLPSFTSAGGGLTTTLEIERYRSHHAVRAALEELSAEQPLLLAFDDVHWADAASLELVSHLLRRAVPRCLLALAYRPHQASRALVEAVAREARESDLRVLELAPLSRSHATALIGGAPPPADFDALYAESGGNPFYLEQLARASDKATRRNLPGGRRSPQPDVPAAVRDAITSELEALSTEALHLLQAAAVTGEPFDLGLATTVADLDEARAFVALDELVAAELLRETDVPGRPVFRHPIVRRAVYDATGSGWLLAAHRRAALALEARGAGIGTRAYHVERSAEVGNQEAIALLTDAAHAAMARAPASAARWLEAAVRVLPENADPVQRLSLLFSLATAFGNLGRLRESTAVLGRALALVPASDVAARGKLTATIARMEQGLGRGSEAHRLLLSALEETDPNSHEAIALTIELATNHLMLREWDAAAEVAAAARARARAFGAPTLFMSAAATGGLVEAFRGTALDHARVLTDEAGAGLDSLDDDEIDATTFEVLASTTFAEASLLRWQASIARAKRGQRISRRLGNGTLFVDFMNVVAMGELMQGRLAEARQVADTAVDAAMLVDNDQRLAPAEAIRCWTLWAQGRHDEALAAGLHAVEAAERAPLSLLSWLAHLVYGRVLVDIGERERGRAEILSAGGRALTEVPPSFRALWHRTLAQIELGAGRIEVAEEMTRLAEEGAAAVDLSMRTADARYARACMHQAYGDLAAAIDAAQDAVAHYEAADTPLEAARARIFAASVLSETGDVAAAEHELTRAHDTAGASGATGLAHRAAQDLRQLGVSVKGKRRRRGPRAHGLAALTPREREIAELVALGHTNRQIAEQLFLSTKTIETHLTQTFAKLEVSSRAAVAAEIARDGVTSEGTASS